MPNETIQITPEEMARLAPLIEALDAELRGFQRGIEAAKTAMVRRMLAERGPVTEQVTEHEKKC